MYHFKLLFHIHTIYSWDGFINFNDLIKVIKKYKITHVCLTEHNNIDSYFKFYNYLKAKEVNTELIPAVEYSTEVGDIIIVGLTNLITFSNWKELIRKAKQLNGLIILPHPFKRIDYPNDLIEAIDYFEIINVRGLTREIKCLEKLVYKPFIYAVDAHDKIELPGIINHIFTENKNLLEALKNQQVAIFPQLVRKDFYFLNKIILVYEKIKRILLRRKNDTNTFNL